MISVGQHRPLHPHKFTSFLQWDERDVFDGYCFHPPGVQTFVCYDGLYRNACRIVQWTRSWTCPFPSLDEISRCFHLYQMPISPKKWTAPLAQSLGETKIVNIKPLRWPRFDCAGCTYCIKSLIEKWQNCTLMHSVRSFHFSDISGLLREVSRVRGGLHPRLFGLRSCE